MINERGVGRHGSYVAATSSMAAKQNTILYDRWLGARQYWATEQQSSASAKRQVVNEKGHKVQSQYLKSINRIIKELRCGLWRALDVYSTEPRTSTSPCVNIMSTIRYSFLQSHKRSKKYPIVNEICFTAGT